MFCSVHMHVHVCKCLKTCLYLDAFQFMSDRHSDIKVTDTSQRGGVYRVLYLE